MRDHESKIYNVLENYATYLNKNNGTEHHFELEYDQFYSHIHYRSNDPDLTFGVGKRIIGKYYESAYDNPESPGFNFQSFKQPNDEFTNNVFGLHLVKSLNIKNIDIIYESFNKINTKLNEIFNSSYLLITESVEFSFTSEGDLYFEMSLNIKNLNFISDNSNPDQHLLSFVNPNIRKITSLISDKEASSIVNLIESVFFNFLNKSIYDLTYDEIELLKIYHL